MWDDERKIRPMKRFPAGNQAARDHEARWIASRQAEHGMRRRLLDESQYPRDKLYLDMLQKFEDILQTQSFLLENLAAEENSLKQFSTGSQSTGTANGTLIHEKDFRDKTMEYCTPLLQQWQELQKITDEHKKSRENRVSSHVYSQFLS
jgi:recombinational DNA repair ATPase RecF